MALLKAIVTCEQIKLPQDLLLGGGAKLRGLLLHAGRRC